MSYDEHMDIPYTKEPVPVGQDEVDQSDIYQWDDYYDIDGFLVKTKNLHAFARWYFTYHEGTA